MFLTVRCSESAVCLIHKSRSIGKLAWMTVPFSLFFSFLFCFFPCLMFATIVQFLLMAQENSSPRPLLIVTDTISGPSGLARIGRDLSVRIHENLSDVYRLGVAGYGGVGSRKFPFPQYHLEGVKSDWVLPSLPEIVEDFAGDERCTVCFIWDLHRCTWFSQPERLAAEPLAKYPRLKHWLQNANIEKWCYVPVDSSGPNDRLSFPIALTALGFDRLLAYGPFGEGVLRRSIGDAEADKRHLTHLPHGIDTSVFYEYPRDLSRKLFFQHTGAQTMLAMLGVNPRIEPIGDDETLIGAVCTNQARKNLPLLCKTIAILTKTHKIRLWLHTDQLEKAFSIPSLLVDYGILDNSVISLGYLPDEKMALGYSACDLTIAPGCEGFGYPGAESLACGTPVIHTSYAGGADIVPKEMQVETLGFYEEGSYASMRPVYSAQHWAQKAYEWHNIRTNLDPKYDWENNWVAWEKYLREAAK